jgi:hypothetical protein
MVSLHISTTLCGTVFDLCMDDLYISRNRPAGTLQRSFSYRDNKPISGESVVTQRYPASVRQRPTPGHYAAKDSGRLSQYKLALSPPGTPGRSSSQPRQPSNDTVGSTRTPTPDYGGSPSTIALRTRLPLHSAARHGHFRRTASNCAAVAGRRWHDRGRAPVRVGPRAGARRDTARLPCGAPVTNATSPTILPGSDHIRVNTNRPVSFATISNQPNFAIYPHGPCGALRISP